jgi:hypothetical protein
MAALARPRRKRIELFAVNPFASSFVDSIPSSSDLIAAVQRRTDKRLEQNQDKTVFDCQRNRKKAEYIIFTVQ